MLLLSHRQRGPRSVLGLICQKALKNRHIGKPAEKERGRVLDLHEYVEATPMGSAAFWERPSGLLQIALHGEKYTS